MREIKVPKVPARAFNKNRPASDLLKRQVAQLQHVVEMVVGPNAQLSARKVKTEGQAAAFIAYATRALHPEGAPPAALPARAASAAPAPPPAGRVSRPRRKTKPRSTTSQPKAAKGRKTRRAPARRPASHPKDRVR